MNLQVFRAIGFGATVFALIHGAMAESPATGGATYDQVQMLANFPALQKLAAKRDQTSLRRYVARVSTTYDLKGYDALAKALSKSGSLILLFGQPERAGTPGALKQARATLRLLESSLAQNHRILLPSHPGERIPNYYAIAKTFTEIAGRAIANLNTGKDVSNFLRRKAEPSWLINKTPPTYSFTTISFTPNSFTYTPAPTYHIPPNTFTYTPDNGSYSSGITGYNSSVTISAGGYFSFSQNAGVLILTAIGDEPASDTTINEGTWVVFPPVVDLSSQTYSFRITYTTPSVINGTTFPTGTSLVRVTDGFVVPDGATLLSLPVVVAPVPTPSPSPSPTPTPTATPTPTPAE